MTVAVKVRPGARRTAPAGVRADALLIDVAAPPEKGKANRELLAWARKALGPLASAPELRAGAGSRSKVILLPGIDEATARRRIAELL